jgi:hypothetical protein
MLSPQLLELLRDWWRIARPAVWMFPGRDRISPMTTRQLTRVCHMAPKGGIAQLGRTASLAYRCSANRSRWSRSSRGHARPSLYPANPAKFKSASSSRCRASRAASSAPRHVCSVHVSQYRAEIPCFDDWLGAGPRKGTRGSEAESPFHSFGHPFSASPRTYASSFGRFPKSDQPGSRIALRPQELLRTQKEQTRFQMTINSTISYI